MTTTPHASPYDALALIYDPWQDAYGRFADLVLPRLMPLLEEEERARRPWAAPARFGFADIGCGSGTLLLELARAHSGWRFCGLDASAAMLATARRKPGANAIDWLHAPMGAALPSPAFHAVGSFFNALNNLADRAALTAAFAAAAAAMVPGALLVFDVNNETGYRLWWNRRSSYHGPGWSFELDTRFERGSNHAHGCAVVTSSAQRHEITLRERCFDEDEIVVCLMTAGLSAEHREPWAPYAADEPGKTWWLARRV